MTLFISDISTFARHKGNKDKHKRKSKTISNSTKKILAITLGVGAVAGIGAGLGKAYLYPKATKAINQQLREHIKADNARVNAIYSQRYESLYQHLLNQQSSQNLDIQAQSAMQATRLLNLERSRAKQLLQQNRRNVFQDKYKYLNQKKREVGSGLAVGSIVLGGLGYTAHNLNNKKKKRN